MGWMSAASQDNAARYLVKTLTENGGRVHYSHFYDATDDTARALHAGMGIDAAEADWIGAESVMDAAAAGMKAQGFVQLDWLDGEKLADGEPAYEIVLTDEGRRKLAADQWPRYRDHEL